MNCTKLSNREFIFICIRLLAEQKKLGDEDLDILIDTKSCMEKFNCSFPIFLEIPCRNNKQKQSPYYGLGIQKYYTEQVKINDRTFLITNQWFNMNKEDSGKKSSFLSWILAKMN
ncbi:MAG: hypothetical protein GX078_04635 [Clostridiales bacterium]|nr:hypothetical protein [Clostridiales bacterium]